MSSRCSIVAFVVSSAGPSPSPPRIPPEAVSNIINSLLAVLSRTLCRISTTHHHCPSTYCIPRATVLHEVLRASWPIESGTWPSDSLVTPVPSLSQWTFHTRFRYACCCSNTPGLNHQTCCVVLCRGLTSIPTSLSLSIICTIRSLPTITSSCWTTTHHHVCCVALLARARLDLDAGRYLIAQLKIGILLSPVSPSSR